MRSAALLNSATATLKTAETAKELRDTDAKVAAAVMSQTAAAASQLDQDLAEQTKGHEKAAQTVASVQEQHQQVQAQLSTADKIAGEAQTLKARMSDEMERAIAKAAETAARAKAIDHKVEVTRDRFKQKMKALAEASEQAVEEAANDHDEAAKKVISVKQMESEMSQKLQDRSRL